VLAAVKAGARPILVMCTSHRNRYDLAGRITAALAKNGGLLVAYHQSYLLVARKMLDGLVPDEDVGHLKDVRKVTLVEFSRLKDVRLTMFDSIVVLAGPRPKNEAAQNVWNEVATRFATEASDKVQIEFALAHSCCMIANPGLVIDASQGIGHPS
jgi:hypothetical protein